MSVGAVGTTHEAADHDVGVDHAGAPHPAPPNVHLVACAQRVTLRMEADLTFGGSQMLPTHLLEAERLSTRMVAMHGMKEIIEEAERLSVEERVMVIDSLLRTINPPLADVESEWMKVAQRRLAERRSGQVEAVSGSEVFARISGRFGP